MWCNICTIATVCLVLSVGFFGIRQIQHKNKMDKLRSEYDRD